MHIRYLSRKELCVDKKNGSEKEQKALRLLAMFCAAASAAVFFSEQS